MPARQLGVRERAERRLRELHGAPRARLHPLLGRHPQPHRRWRRADASAHDGLRRGVDSISHPRGLYLAPIIDERSRNSDIYSGPLLRRRQPGAPHSTGYAAAYTAPCSTRMRASPLLHTLLTTRHSTPPCSEPAPHSIRFTTRRSLSTTAQLPQLNSQCASILTS